MRISLTAALCVFATLTIRAKEENSVKVQTQADEITVYLNGAEMRHRNMVKLVAGRNKIIVGGLSPFLQPKSVHVTLSGNTEILSIITKSNFLNIEKLNPRVKYLKDSLERLENRIINIHNQLEAYQTEKEVLNRNQYVGSEQGGVLVSELQKAALFYRQSALNINQALSALNKQLAEIAFSVTYPKHRKVNIRLSRGKIYCPKFH